MTKRKIIYTIIALSSIFLMASTYTNYVMYMHYNNSHGKTRALFGLNELFQYGYKFYFGILPLAGLVASLFIATTNKNIRSVSLLAALISFIAILFSVFSVWRLFI